MRVFFLGFLMLALFGQPVLHVPEESPTPSPTPTPQIATRTIHVNGCSYTGGTVFQPTQAVWQDDDHFKNVPNPVLRLLKDRYSFRAELAMVADRDTVIFGAKHYYFRGLLYPVNPPRLSRKAIVFNGETTCSKDVEVKAQFTLTDSTGTRVIYTSQVIGKVKIEGPSAPPTPWQVSLATVNGVPISSRFHVAAGKYDLVASLVDVNGNPTGISTTVSGKSVTTVPLPITFTPIILHPLPSPSEVDDLESRAERLAAASQAQIPDFYPEKPSGVPASHGDAVNLSRLKDANQDVFSSKLANELSLPLYVSGVARVVAVVDPKDFDLLDSSSVAFANSTKAVFVRSDEGVETVAHELVHTIPAFSWADDEMNSLCNDNYHNDHGDHKAYGERLNLGGAQTRKNEDRVTPIMGSSATGRIWTTQCTYRHLADALQATLDPQLRLVRGILTKKNGVVAATLSAMYDINGTADRGSAHRPARHRVSQCSRRARERATLFSILVHRGQGPRRQYALCLSPERARRRDGVEDDVQWATYRYFEIGIAPTRYCNTITAIALACVERRRRIRSLERARLFGFSSLHRDLPKRRCAHPYHRSL